MRKMRFLWVVLCLLATLGQALAAGSLSYSDGEMQMSITIEQPSWTYYADRGAGQVYFFNGSKQNNNSLISVTTQVVSGDAGKQMDRLWQAVRGSLAGLDVRFGSMKNVQVGEDAQARLYSYEITSNGEKLQSYCVFWQAGERLYLCTASSDSATATEVKAALDDLLESFQALP